MTGRAGVRPLPLLRSAGSGPVDRSGAAGVPPLVVPDAVALDTWPSVTDRHWRQRASCAGTDPDLFYPVDSEDPDQAAPALAVCARCRVRSSCLVDVMATEEPARRWGITGGMTPSERTALHVSRRPTPTAGGEAA